MYRWNLKYDMNELIYGTDSETQKRFMVVMAEEKDVSSPPSYRAKKGDGREKDWEFGLADANYYAQDE